MLLVRLDVDVAGAPPDRLGEERVDEPDDGRLLGAVEARARSRSSACSDRAARRAQLRQRLGELRRVAVEPLDRLADGRAARATAIRTSRPDRNLSSAMATGRSGRPWRSSASSPASAIGTSWCRRASACGTASSASRGTSAARGSTIGSRYSSREQRDHDVLGDEAELDSCVGERRRLLRCADRERELLGGELAAPPQELSESRRHRACGRRTRTRTDVSGCRGNARPALRSASTIAASGARRPVHALERERALVQQHRGAVERRTAGARRGGAGTATARAVDQVDEEAAARRGADADRERLAGEADRRRVDDQACVRRAPRRRAARPAARPRPARAQVVAQPRGQRLAARRRAVRDHDVARSRRRPGSRRPRARCRRRRSARRGAPREPHAARAASGRSRARRCCRRRGGRAAKRDRVDGADAARLRRHLVEEREHGLLERHGEVEARRRRGAAPRRAPPAARPGSRASADRGAAGRSAAKAALCIAGDSEWSTGIAEDAEQPRLGRASSLAS